MGVFEGSLQEVVLVRPSQGASSRHRRERQGVRARILLWLIYSVSGEQPTNINCAVEQAAILLEQAAGRNGA